MYAVYNKFKLFIVTLMDNSGKSVLQDIRELKKLTDKVYELTPQQVSNSPLSYKSSNFAEIDSIILMSKFYPWIIKYTSLKGLNPDKPRYLTKVTQTI